MKARSHRILPPVLWLIALMLPGAAAAPAPEAPAAGAQDEAAAEACVILVHGMGRHASSMRKMEKHLLAAGYRTVNLEYPSTDETIERLASEHLAAGVQECQSSHPYRTHFVTHSLGGILVRQYLQNHSLPEGTRIVMLAPPNHGSEVTDKLRNAPPYRWITGPPGQALGTEPGSTPNQLGPVSAQIGIIAGDRSLDPWFSAMIPGPDDGKVAVASTQLEGMTDFIVVHASHGFIMKKEIVRDQVVHFLVHGRFDHPPAAGTENGAEAAATTVP